MINPMKEESETRKKLHATALEAPKTSGVYLWKDETGRIIYVGKAKSLKNRLSSYFTSNRDLKTRILVSRAHSLEYITTDNEYEALLLENTLIKHHSPRYNINLKDGKTYPVIKITNEPFPRIYRTRRVLDDGASYFGPFPNLPAIDAFLEFVNRNYRVRQCKVLKKRSAPCLYYHIGRCSAPCCGKITKEEYRASLEEVVLLLGGEGSETIARVEELMKEAAAELRFEKAARLRDGLRALADLRGQNAVVDMDPESRDYVAWASEGIMVTFAVLRMRSGRLMARDLYRAKSLKDEEELLPEFLMAYYTDPAAVPPRIFVPTEEGLSLAARWFADGLGVRTELAVIGIEGPGGTATAEAASTEAASSEAASSEAASSEAASSEAASTEAASTEAAEEPAEYATNMRSETAAWGRRHAAAMAMAAFNAREDAKRRLREHGDYPALEELKSVLALPSVPSRIEGFDIAHIGGRLPVASLITFVDGNPDRKGYRTFRLRTTDGVIDDFASMREVTSRRYTRLLNEGAELPDLILIDGGIGQVNAVRGVLDSLGLDIPIVGLAKRDEELYLPGSSTPARLPRRSDALRLLQRVRDETHRFATSKNQRLRTKENTRLAFESLPGIGAKRAAALLSRYGSLESLLSAAKDENGLAELAGTARVGTESARAILEALPALLLAREEERARRAGGTDDGQDARASSMEELARGALSAGTNEETKKNE